jgi:hypothetical protein
MLPADDPWQCFFFLKKKREAFASSACKVYAFFSNQEMEQY